jgi:hypothetical protein
LFLQQIIIKSTKRDVLFYKPDTNGIFDTALLIPTVWLRFDGSPQVTGIIRNRGIHRSLHLYSFDPSVLDANGVRRNGSSGEEALS